jgi:NAD(P)-dependent dehydrogenase (short-subunit alcohol dehydrogenase family)
MNTVLIQTPLVHSLEETQGQRLPTFNQAFDRKADPMEPARVIAFLLSDDATFVTGSVYRGIDQSFIRGKTGFLTNQNVSADGGWLS